ncbi:ATP-binding SpoIIE family protein phosphatase [Draconibacterium sp. IB214405]|uniref:ATP-binding SpoIIE family protein phosphatase n=1 Tax=Draconibacterium sp. IB214405 TaxID=3097352 RepID=UPI002A0E3FFE|nr:ATP-binding SpoIIE family protein phosphatase [Draconibacterium sp. IB214405]MDX8340820.1 ATP-binding SpoIIE family protein phosphatase [Draconibacterium sp. IB214405]
MIREQKLTLLIENESDIGICRRKSVSLGTQIGFDDVKSGEIAIVITELVTNVLKHGGRKGKILVNEVKTDDGNKGIEVWCCDSGPGIPDIEQALKDGFSNKVSLGIGLGSIRRFSDVFEVNPTDIPFINENDQTGLNRYSNCIRTLKWVPTKKWLGANRSLQIGAASRSKPGEQLNGDCYVINHISSTKTVVAVIDGLGHGKEAHMASQLAREQILLKSGQSVDNLLNHVHEGTKGTRGLVASVVSIDTEKRKVVFSGIGNIDGFVYSSDKKNNLLSYGGIIGHNMRTPRVFEYAFNPGDFLCLSSDGITSRWQFDNINWKEHPQKNAEFLITNYSRNNDDATILIVRYDS